MNKKLILSAAVVAAIGAASFAAFNTYQHPSEFTDLELANIEALTRDESNGVTETCWKSITGKEGSKVLYCPTCTWIDNSTDTWYSSSAQCP